ncbi:rifin [Plasmodium reichenowi]|uniref:Rifin n=2 Tax=Plasmodium reichenowi TaxID=5854 RepID=A0A060RM18_PLARE|nr:rifin [Plasmodium reichenowi]
MKLHYSKILLFVIALNILVTSYHEHNNNEPYVTTHHTATTISRVLSEKDIESSSYDKDADMKSVKEKFDRQTSQRFEEYEERMKQKRQKSKEERDKKTQEIIDKDKMDKSLAQKVEIGCLRCGCALGGVAASVGIFGTVAVKELAKAAMTAAEITAKEAAIAEAAAKGAEAAIDAVIEGLKKLYVSNLDGKELVSYITAQNYNNVTKIALAINRQYDASSCILGIGGSGAQKPICPWVKANFEAAGNDASAYKSIEIAVKPIVSNAETLAGKVTEKAIEDAILDSTLAVDAKYAICQTAITASVVAILVIVLVMIIIYLVLRYRRKTKMNKKAQYTKLLEE